MLKTVNFIILLFLQTPFLCKSQESARYLPEKPGKWSYSTNIKTPDAEVVAFNKNVANVAEWFHRNVPLLSNPKGFDLDVCAYGIWDDKYKLRPCNYGQRGELNFNFLLFYSNGGQWKIEPPHWSFDINNTETGHGSNFNLPGWDNTKDPASFEKPMNKAAADLNDLFRIFPFVRDIAPGVRLYDDGKLIVFNPDRPSFWIPVTMRELSDMFLDYYSLRDKTEMDKLLLDQLKKEIAELTEEELNAPAYEGHDSHFVLKANGHKTGLQIMRFNPEYWDRSLPPSTIQLITMYYQQMNEAEKEEHFKNNGYPVYGQLMMNAIKFEELAGLISRKK